MVNGEEMVKAQIRRTGQDCGENGEGKEKKVERGRGASPYMLKGS